MEYKSNNHNANQFINLLIYSNDKDNRINGAHFSK